MKILSLAAVAVMAVAVTSCRKEEEIDLEYLPDSKVGFAIDGVEGNPSVITLQATYDGEGVLTANGELTRTFIFTVDTPNPYDIVFELEAIHEGLPEDYVVLSTETLTIPAGYKSASVDVTFVPEDLSFAAIEAETYEIGVRVKELVDPFKTVFEGESEAKVIVEKVPYKAEASIILDPSGANSINFKRSYVDGEIINEDAMTFDFKAVLNRPALVDMEVPVLFSGLPSGFDKCVTFSEPTLKFAAGSKESSNVITCDIADDFLLNGVEEPEAFALVVVADFSNYETGGMSESGALVANVTKALDLMTIATAADFASFEKYTNSGWTATGDGSGSIGTMFDGVNTGYNDYYYFYYFTVDFKEIIPLNGFKVYCYYSSISYMPNHFTVEVSDDGEAWKAIGEVTNGRSGGHPVHVLFLKTINARYLKFTSLETSRYSTDFVEFELYHK